MSRQFPLPPAGALARLMPLLLGGVLPLLMAALIWGLAPRDEPELPRALLSLLVLPVAGVAFAMIVHDRKVELLPGMLRVRRWPWPKDFPLHELDLEAASVVELQARPELQPVLKMAGSRLPGFRSGWFWLRDRRRAYVLTSTSTRVALVPRRDGSVLLLGVERPDALVSALGDAGRRHR